MSTFRTIPVPYLGFVYVKQWLPGYQCCGSMTFWGGSASADLCLWLMDKDPTIFVNDLQDTSIKLIFNTIFSAYYFLKLHLNHFSLIKSQKESQNSRNQGFSYYFYMMIEGSGSIPLTSGSGRPKNMWIRIRNTAGYSIEYSSCWFQWSLNI